MCAHINEQISPFVIIVFGTFVVHQISWFLFNLLYMLIDDYKWFPQYKIRSEDDSVLTKSMRWRTFRGLFIDHLIQMLPLQLLSYPLLRAVGFSTDAATLPSLREWVWEFVLFNAVEDAGFYWVHRLLHTSWAYAKIHKKHHEYIAPFSLVGEIAHPAEFLFNFLLPMMAGPFIVGLYRGHIHIVSFWVWMTFREMRGTEAHSGYNLPFHPLRLLDSIYGGSKAHEYHHSVIGRSSNFGGYKLWDWLMGTDRVSNERRRAAQKRNANSGQ